MAGVQRGNFFDYGVAYCLGNLVIVGGWDRGFVRVEGLPDDKHIACRTVL